MNKQQLIEKLIVKKSENNNTIDLNAYITGMSEMYDEIEKIK